MASKLRIQRITTDPDPYEPFRLALGYRVGDVLYISGQAAISPEGEVVGAGDFDRQAEQVFANLERVLKAGGSSLENVVKVTIFLTDMAQLRQDRRAARQVLHAAVSRGHDRRGHLARAARADDRDRGRRRRGRGGRADLGVTQRAGRRPAQP